ncbi:NAD(P)-binding protein [Nemania abortiva]|nr:NAD(P)-binding protein [Nemania abortiva]
MAGTIVFTGANSSLGIPAVECILRKYSGYTAIFTVRDASESDVNTNKIRKIISSHRNAKSFIHELDLFSLSSVHAVADEIVTGIKNGKYPPLAAIVCNAYYWDLVGNSETTPDGFDKTLQVNHISQAALVLRLLGSFGDAGRIITISSDSHWPGKNGMEVYPPSIPDDLNLLLKPTTDEDKYGRGYQRYATSKLVFTTWTHALNRHLLKNPDLAKISAIAMNPGNMVDSRALRRNTPISLQRKQTFLFKPLQPLLNLMDSTLRTTAPAAVDVVDLALNHTYAGQRGFYTLLRKDESSPESMDETKQELIWHNTLEWARITPGNTAL